MALYDKVPCEKKQFFFQYIKNVIILSFFLSLISFSHGAEWFWGAAGSLASSCIGNASKTFYNTTASYVGQQLTIPKEDENTLYMHVNSLKKAEIEELCTDKISTFNTEVLSLKRTYAQNLKTIETDLAEKEKLITDWVKLYIFTFYTVGIVLDFQIAYKETYSYVQSLNNPNNYLSPSSKENLATLYQNQLDYLDNRRKTIGALLYTNFSYTGQGGYLDRVTSHTSRQKKREKLWGVYSFAITDSQKTIDSRDNPMEPASTELDTKLNMFKEKYKKAADIISKPAEDIIKSLYPEGINLEIVYGQLGLTCEGIKPTSSFSSNPYGVSLTLEKDKQI